MTNQALPQSSRQLLEHHINQCRNLGLILDKFAPWGQHRGQWDLVTLTRPRANRDAQVVTGGQAKGHWLKTSAQIYRDESSSIFINSADNEFIPRANTDFIKAKQTRWERMVYASGGIGFSMRLTERMAAGLGASHVLETGLTLDRNTGLPYLPGSTIKGLARAWGLIVVASQFSITLEDRVKPDGLDGKKDPIPALNHLNDILISAKPNIPQDQMPNIDDPCDDPTIAKTLDCQIKKMLAQLPDNEVKDNAGIFVDLFRLIFGSQSNAGAICFTDGIYYSQREPKYAADVMTPHFVEYYTGNGAKPPADDDNPNPVSFLTVDKGNTFAFGLLPRSSAFAGLDIPPDDVLVIARDWLINALSQLGAGSKTAAGYGFFSKSKKSVKMVVGE